MSSDATVPSPCPCPLPSPPPRRRREPGREGTPGLPRARRNRRRGGPRHRRLCAASPTASESTDDAQIDADVVPISARVAGAVLTVPCKDNQTVKAGDVARGAGSGGSPGPAGAGAGRAGHREGPGGCGARAGAGVRCHRQGQASTARKAVLSGSSVAVASADAQVAAAQAALERAKTEAHRNELDICALQAAARGRRDLRSSSSTTPRRRMTRRRRRWPRPMRTCWRAQEAKRGAVSKVAEAEGRVAQTENVDAQVAAAHAATALAEARVKAAEAALALAENAAALHEDHRARRTAWCRSSASHAGQLVGVGTPVAELVPAETYVVANFKETQIGEMHPGDRVKVEIDAFPGHELEGRVESLSGGTGARFSLLPPDNASGNFVKVVQRVPVRIAWKSPPDVAAARGPVRGRHGLRGDRWEVRPLERCAYGRLPRLLPYRGGPAMPQKYLLSEEQIPRHWYNIIADLPSPPAPVLHPGTRQPVRPDDLAPLFPMALIEQEVSGQRAIDIPEEVRDALPLWRPYAALPRPPRWSKRSRRAPTSIYKYEGVSPAGSHKPNTAVAQAYYNKAEGIRRLATETGAGQWGSALAFACAAVRPGVHRLHGEGRATSRSPTAAR